jgi:hypothetical protein
MEAAAFAAERKSYSGQPDGSAAQIPFVTMLSALPTRPKANKFKIEISLGNKKYLKKFYFETLVPKLIISLPKKFPYHGTQCRV